METGKPPRDELAALVSYLKNYILFEHSIRGRCGNLYMKGNAMPHDEVRATAMTKMAAPHVPVTLDNVRRDLGDCQRCGLSGTRRNLVFGEGDENAALVFVGEAPGEQEDKQGKPFVGRAGQLLTKIIEAMGFKRDEVYICNILKCRPPGNRNPRSEEIAACEPFLIRQLEVIQPKVICALGTFAARTLLKTEIPISVMRGKFHSYQGIKLMPTYHPAYLLRNPGAKKKVWEDVQMIMKELK